MHIKSHLVFLFRMFSVFLDNRAYYESVMWIISIIYIQGGVISDFNLQRFRSKSIYVYRLATPYGSNNPYVQPLSKRRRQTWFGLVPGRGLEVSASFYWGNNNNTLFNSKLYVNNVQNVELDFKRSSAICDKLILQIWK